MRAVGLLLLARASIPGDRRHAEGERRQAAERDRRQQEFPVVALALGSLIQLATTNRDRQASDLDGNIGLGKIVG